MRQGNEHIFFSARDQVRNLFFVKWLVMILKHFPDPAQSNFNLDAPCPEFGWPNMVVQAKASRVAYPEHRGPLSIKCAFNGQEAYAAEGARFMVDDTSYLLLNDGQRYSSCIESNDKVESFCVFFRPGFAEEILRSLVTSADCLLDAPDGKIKQPVSFFERIYRHDNVLSPALLRIRTTIKAKPVTQGWLEDQFHALLELLLRVHRNVYRELERLPSIRQSTRVELYRRLCRAKDFIDASLPQALDLEQMASVACLSPHHFLRLFKQAFGETPHQYLTRKRLAMAKRLLLQTESPVTDICMDVGFESLGSFSWLFHRRIGIPPDLFRRLKGAIPKKAILEKPSVLISL